MPREGVLIKSGHLNNGCPEEMSTFNMPGSLLGALYVISLQMSYGIYVELVTDLC